MSAATASKPKPRRLATTSTVAILVITALTWFVGGIGLEALYGSQDQSRGVMDGER